MADIAFKCPNCPQHLRAAEEDVGHYVKCPHCKNRTRVPEPIGTLECSQCHTSVKISPSGVGETFRCPSCGADVHLTPKPSATSAPTPIVLKPPQPAQPTPALPPSRFVSSIVTPLPESTGTGPLICPTCWQRFDKGDALHIANHEALRGDPILGEDAPLRFYATRFDDEGRALDPLGVPCTDIACPACLRKLPPAFFDSPHYIFSIIGAPGAGKSYYLSVLAKILPRVLYQHYDIVFKDADPTGNAALNALKDRLFSGATPEQVYLDKTALEGSMYERLQRHGRIVALPRPFTFAVCAPPNASRRCSVIFYDNAGEHFEPGIDDASSPGAQHVTAAAALFFLFDPTTNHQFRLRLGNHPDPQLHLAEHADQQHVILAEMETRIRRQLALPAHQRIRTPLAILIGKCDVWLPLLGKDAIAPMLRADGLDRAAIAANSKRLRALLKELSPEIVANAESLAEEVVYFPVSSFGHSPVQLPDGRIAPDPHHLQPQFVEAPVLWALTRAAPGMIPLAVAT